jgi:soluble lytic murein transglycosylase-like protein
MGRGGYRLTLPVAAAGQGVKGAAMRARSTLPTTVMLTVAAMGSVVHADIYRFVDDAGVVHFSNVPADSRYSLYIVTPVVRDANRAGNSLQRAAEFDPAIRRAAHTAAVRPELVRAVIAVESAFNPAAVSRRGAVGLMQLKPETARRYGVANAFDPEQNILGGARYLRDLLVRYGNDLELTLAAYNAGEDAVERYGRSVPPFSETRRYVPAVMRLYRALLAQPAAS